MIVVDNASDGAVIEYLDRTQRADPRIQTILNSVNYGFSYAVNQGIKLADSTADILILNNDAMLTKGSVEALQAVAYSADDIAISAPRQVLLRRTKTIRTHVPYAAADQDCDVNLSAHHNNVLNVPVFSNGQTVELNFVPFFCVYIKRSVLEKTGGLDAELGRHYRSDRIMCDFVRRILKMRIVYTPHSVVYHKLQRSTDVLRQDDKLQHEFDELFRKNQWPDHLRDRLGFRLPAWDL